MLYDPDEWESYCERKPCSACDGDMRKCNGMCNGSAHFGQRRRSQEEVAKIKAEKYGPVPSANVALSQPSPAAGADYVLVPRGYLACVRGILEEVDKHWQKSRQMDEDIRLALGQTTAALAVAPAQPAPIAAGEE